MHYDYYDHLIRGYIIEHIKRNKEAFENDVFVECVDRFFLKDESDFFKNTLNELHATISYDNNLSHNHKRNRRKSSVTEFDAKFDSLFEEDPLLLKTLKQRFIKFLEAKEYHFPDKPKIIVQVQEAFKLNELETRLLCFFVCLEYATVFQRFTDEIMISRRIDHFLMKKMISHCFGISEALVNANLSKNSKLMKYNLIEKNSRDYSINDDLFIIIMDNLDSSLISKYVKNVDCHITWPLESFQLNQTKIKTLISILSSKKPVNILLYGGPGTGKTEIAKTIAFNLGKPLYSLNISDDDKGEDINERKRSLVTIQNHPAMENALILVDECDTLINNRINFSFFGSGKKADDKAWINEYFDQNLRQILWVSNSISHVDESLLRRFDFILPFPELTNTQREEILKSLISKHQGDYLNEDDISNLSSTSKINTGHFSRAMEVVAKIDEDQSAKRLHFFNIIKEYQKVLSGQSLKLKKLSEDYSLQGLNIDRDPKDMIEYSKKVIKNLEEGESAEGNLNILLYGPPGAGKTEFVKYLAKSLGKELVLKRASDLKSMWVGETEKLIRRAFNEAEEKGHVLFIDEADTFFQDRESAHRSYEVSQVNELLTCMENFKGILICATNFVENLDKASMRRFLFKLKFDYLKPEGVDHFFQHFFQRYSLGELSLEERADLHKIKGLTPSDFYTINRKYVLMAPVDNAEVINDLAMEVSHKAHLFKKKIGVQ